MAKLPELQGKFFLTKFLSYYPDGYQDDRYVVSIKGARFTIYCNSTARPRDEALRHFWRWIGAI